jgi:CRISPR-associated protein Cmr3
MNRYILKPQDVLFFRDGRELHASESYTASTVFPPPPGTLYGAIRSAILAKAGADFSTRSGTSFGLTDAAVLKVAGTRTTTGTLRLSGVVMSKGSSVLHYVPSDVKRPKMESDETALRVLKPVPLPASVKISGLTEDALLPDDGSRTPLVDVHGYLSESDYLKYLHQGLAPSYVVKTSELWVIEQRTHVSIDAAKQTAADTKLFSIPFLRFDDGFAMVVDLDGDEDLLGDEGWLRLGGEQKAVRYRRISATQMSFREVHRDGQIRVVLTSPAPFSSGWLPDGWSESSPFPFLGGEARLLSSVISRYGIVSGWDLANHRPKPARRAVQPGSVYHLSVSGLDPDLVRIHPSLCTETDDIRTGFGTFHLGQL